MSSPSSSSATVPGGGTDTGTAAMSVLVADKFEQSGLDALQRLGFHLVCEADLSAETLPAALKEHNPDVLIVRSTKVSEIALRAAPDLSLVVRAGAGYDTIDVATASSRGVFVANCPGRNAMAVAELAWALILSCDRRVPDQTADLRAGTWNKKGYSVAEGLHGRTLGILGYGTIGAEVAHRGRAFGMRIVAWSRSLTPERAAELGVGHAASPLDVATRADVISIHVASTADTAGLVDDRFIDAMKPGATLVNTSRGAVVDEAALTRGIREKGIRAGLDVFAKEPAAGDTAFIDAIVQEPGVYGTHHVGASTEQAQQAIASETVRIIEVFRRTGAPPNCVNLAQSTSGTALVTVRHFNRPGVLAHVLRILSEAGTNVEEMENVLYDGQKAACARIRTDQTPDADQIARIRSNENVLSAEVTAPAK